MDGKDITRTQDEAKALAYKILDQAKGGANFDDLVKANTDDQAPGIYEIANLGVDPTSPDEAPRDGLVPAFGNVGFKLKPGEIGIADYDPEIIVLMPCGFTLERTVEEFTQMKFPAEWRRLNAVHEGRVYAVDGSAYFNRPGPRIGEGLKILAEVIHPEIFPRTTPPQAWRR